MLNLHFRAVGAWSMNAYVLTCPQTKHSVLIDPGAEPETLAEMLAGTQPQAIWVTHSHPDHIGALTAMRKRLSVPVMAHPGLDPDASAIAADRWLTHGDALPVGRFRLKVFHTPGHTPDQVCFAVQDDHRIIVGDTLFAGGPGKTWSAQGFRQTLHTLRDQVMPWPDDTLCYPGHGSSFRLGDQRTAMARFLKKNHGDFYGDATWDR